MPEKYGGVGRVAGGCLKHNALAPFFAIYGPDGRVGRWRESKRHDAGRKGLQLQKMTPSAFPATENSHGQAIITAGKYGNVIILLPEESGGQRMPNSRK